MGKGDCLAGGLRGKSRETRKGFQEKRIARDSGYLFIRGSKLGEGGVFFWLLERSLA